MKKGHSQTADQAAVVIPKSKTVSEQDPLDAYHPEENEALHHDREDVLPSDQSSVEEGQAWRHQHHQSSADKHPGGIRAIYCHL
jgi:hypothetical protein